jgi:aspartate/methionine/tyrosine aminotransferase
MNGLIRSYDAARKKGVQVRGLVVINPGNPTGTILSKQEMKDIIAFCRDNRIVLLADEVYQENVYSEKPWYSFKGVLGELSEPERRGVEMVSFHSVSKGLLGECGRRGGYFECYGRLTHVFNHISDEFRHRPESYRSLLQDCECFSLSARLWPTHG